MQTAIVNFCKKTEQNLPESKGEFVRCIFESLALKYKSTLEKINLITGKPAEVLRIVGGGSQNEMLNQFTADASGIPVIAGPIEAAAIGNIMVQAMARGKIHSLKEGRMIVGRSFKLKEYLPQHAEKWAEVYKRIQSNI